MIETIVAGVLCGIILKEVLERCIIWRQRSKYLQEHQEFIEQLQQFDEGYHPEEPDIKCAEECSEYLKELFPYGIKQKVSSLSEPELKELFSQIVNESQRIMNVSVNDLEFYTDAQPPRDSYCGYYCFDDNTFHLNWDFIRSGSAELIEEQVYTIFHEMKHARQWKAVFDESNSLGYSQEQILLWADNFNNYIPTFVSDELYRKQFIERDAFGFEELIKEKMA